MRKRRASINGAYGTDDSVLEHRPSIIRTCRLFASFLSSRTRRLFPTPASPPRRRTFPSPVAARSSRSRSERRESSRPTDDGQLSVDRIMSENHCGLRTADCGITADCGPRSNCGLQSSCGLTTSLKQVRSPQLFRSPEWPRETSADLPLFFSRPSLRRGCRNPRRKDSRRSS